VTDGLSSLLGHGALGSSQFAILTDTSPIRLEVFIRLSGLAKISNNRMAEFETFWRDVAVELAGRSWNLLCSHCS